MLKLNTIRHRLSEAAGRLKQWVTSLLHWQQATLLPPAAYDGPSPSEALARDGRTRWLILAVLSAVEEADLKFISALVKGQEVEREHSLAWLEEHGCIKERRQWQRNFFWEPRREVIFYAITPLGQALLAQIHAAAQEGSLGPLLRELGTGDSLPKVSAGDRFRRLAMALLELALLALMVVTLAQLLPSLVSMLLR